MSRRIFPLLGVLLAPLALIAGIYLGGHPQALPEFVRDALVDDREGRVYDEAVDRIVADFFRPVDRDKLLDTSLGAAVRSLEDRFSHYFDPKTYRQFKEVTGGEFEGVGMTVQQHPRGLRVLQVFDGGPAARAGLRRGDLITAVDGRAIKGKPSDVATALIKGPKGTLVRLEVVSGDRRRSEVIRRAAVNVPVVAAGMERSGGRRIAHVKLDSFSSGAHAELRRAVREHLRKGARGVILDLRDNGGGLLQEAVLVSSVFIADGVIVTTKGRARPSHTFEASGRSIDRDVPLVVLVNRTSASASEIVAGAVQDRGRGQVVGEATFGKGVFQEVVELPNGGALDITVGEYFTPKGRNLGPRDGKRGIQPDVRAVDRAATPRVDEALQAALRVVTRG